MTERPHSILKEYIGDRYRFGVRRLQHTMNLIKLPQLEIMGWSYTKEFVEDCQQCSFGHPGCRHQFFNLNEFAFALP